MRMTVVLIAAVLGLAVVAVVVLRGRSYDPARDAAWLAGSVAVGSAEAEVYGRYLQRHRTHRRVGGIFGVLFALVTGIAWYSDVRLGVGGGRSPLADPLFCGIVGVLLGALSAETYRLRLPRVDAPAAAARGPVAASLAPRAELPGDVHVRAARGVAVGAVLTGAAMLAATGDGGPAAVAVLGAALQAVCEVTRHAVRHRRRPALSPRAMVVDLRIREFAAASVARLGLAGVVLAAAWAVAALPDGPAWWNAVTMLVMLGGLGVAVYQLVKAGPRPPRWTTRAHPYAGLVQRS